MRQTFSIDSGRGKRQVAEAEMVADFDDVEWREKD